MPIYPKNCNPTLISEVYFTAHGNTRVVPIAEKHEVSGKSKGENSGSLRVFPAKPDTSRLHSDRLRVKTEWTGFT